MNPLPTEATRSKSKLSLRAFPLLFPNQTGHCGKESRTRVKGRQFAHYRSHLSEVRPNYNNHYCDARVQDLTENNAAHPLPRTARADTRGSKRGKHVLFVDAFVCGHQPQNAIEGADSQGKVIWNREALRERFICLQDNMTAFLMDLAIVPMFAERLNDSTAGGRAGFSCKNFITHKAEADPDGKFFGLIEVKSSHCFTHVGAQFVPTLAFGDDAFGQALRTKTTICLLNHFKDEFVHERSLPGI